MAASPESDDPLIVRLIARQGAIVVACLAAVTLLAWAWLAADSGHDMAGGMAGMGAMQPAAVWTAGYLGSAFVMWSLMMVAMMLPSAAPMILLYGRVAARDGGLALISIFVLAYLAVWTGFSAVAALAQAALISTGLVGEAALAVSDRRIAGALLLLAGLYQLSPFKQACLDQCRSPLSFIIRLSRPGARGALRLGLAHGLYCLGCCWALMLLLFVGGVMNLAWIAALAILVLVEKVAPAPLPTRRLIGSALCIAGATFLIAPWIWA